MDCVLAQAPDSVLGSIPECFVAAFWLRFGCANPSQACNAMHGSVQPLRQTAPLQHRAQRGQQVAPDPRLTGPGAHWLSRYLQGLRNVGRLPCANGLRGAHILQQHVVFKVQIKLCKSRLVDPIRLSCPSTMSTNVRKPISTEIAIEGLNECCQPRPDAERLGSKCCF